MSLLEAEPQALLDLGRCLLDHGRREQVLVDFVSCPILPTTLQEPANQSAQIVVLSIQAPRRIGRIAVPQRKLTEGWQRHFLFLFPFFFFSSLTRVLHTHARYVKEGEALYLCFAIFNGATRISKGSLCTFVFVTGGASGIATVRCIALAQQFEFNGQQPKSVK